MTRYLLIIMLILCSVKSNGQKNITNSLGLRLGSEKTSYYDETLNFKVYNKTIFNPTHLHYKRTANKNNYIINFIYSNTTLSPNIEEYLVLNDEIDFQMASLDFTYLRNVFNLNEKLGFKLGAKFSSNGYGGERIFRKAYVVNGTKFQDTYEVTFISIYASGAIKYSISESLEMNLRLACPLLALNSKNYNSKGTPLENELYLVSLDKYSGFSSDLSIIKKFNRFSFELFHALYFYKYKSPNNKQLLTNKIGLGIYYEF